MRTASIPAAAALVMAVACRPAAPVASVLPVPDTAAIAARHRADSIAAAAAAQARADAIRLADQRHADSIAAQRQTQKALDAELAALIHFDFDKAVIRALDDTALDQKVAIMLANPALQIKITGNCDERGSDEYNLALGNRRAIIAKAYLVNHGINASRIEIASNGEEKPLDPGHTETAWAMDRNDQFTSTTSVVLRNP